MLLAQSYQVDVCDLFRSNNFCGRQKIGIAQRNIVIPKMMRRSVGLLHGIQNEEGLANPIKLIGKMLLRVNSYKAIFRQRAGCPTMTPFRIEPA